MDFKHKYDQWINQANLHEELRKELIGLTDEKEIEDRFYKELEFGTGGLRGVIAAGTNRMNIYTVGKATQGLANYLNETEESPSVCIAYDSRNKSEEFAVTAAKVLAANGVKVYLYESLRPTPMLSFAVRHMKASGGIVITASHNPKIYNGYKVYGNDGGQITDEAAKAILSAIDACDIFNDVKTISVEEAVKQGLLEYLGKEVDEAYYAKVSTLITRKELVKEKAKELKIIYTPIHGSGNIPVRTMLDKLGFEQVTVVKEQELPDGNFPTASYPNPENKDVFELAIELAKEVNPDLIFGTDPDCDRIGVVIRENSGEFRVLTGNQVGILLTDYRLRARKEEGILESKDAVIKTIVTTSMADTLCKAYGVECINVLTGFKYIGEKIQKFLDEGTNNFVLGFEESYGYLAGEFVRDKDAVIASVLIAEMALYYKEKGINLYEALQAIYKEHGYYKEDLISIEKKGKQGQEEIKAILDGLRKEQPTTVGATRVVAIEDYYTQTRKDLVEGRETRLELPVSNVIKFFLEDGSWFVIRPSGTEPKMKIYISVIGQDADDAEVRVKALTDCVLNEVIK